MTVEAKPKKKSRLVLIIVGVLALLCIVCGIFAAISGSTPEAKATATARALTRTAEASKPTEAVQTTNTAEVLAPTSTTRPTNTIAPTDTPKPTKTPVPTNTLEPTDTSKLTLAEEAYAAKVAKIGSQYSDAFTAFSTLAAAVSEDASLLLDEDWKTKIAFVLVTMQSLNEDVRALDPPERFMDVHNYLLEAAEHYDNFINLFSEGIDELDIDKITKATEEVLLGNEAIGQATEKVYEITK